MTLTHSTLAAITLSLLAAACSTTSASVDTAAIDTTAVDTMSTEPDASSMSGDRPSMVATPQVRATYQPEGDAYTVVLMRANADMHVPSRDELAELIGGHSDFMQAMTDEGYILAQGPIVPPRSTGGLRSMYFIDSDDAIGTYERVCNDPAAESGLYEMEAMTFITEADIDAFAKMPRAGDMSNPRRPRMRAYTAVVAPSSAALTAMLQQMGDAVVFHGHCTSGSLEDSTLCIIDASTTDQARRMMAVIGPDSDDFEYHAWIAPVRVADMN